MDRREWLPLFEDLTNKYPRLVFWKHLDRGLGGHGDIDTIAPVVDVDSIGCDFVRLVFERFPRAKGVVDCRDSTNVRPHFVVFEEEYPQLFQFDVSWRPTRLLCPWCNPEYLSGSTMIDDNGVRILTPGALSVVLIMLYGIAPGGADRLPPHDREAVRHGIRTDARAAHVFIDTAIAHALRNGLHDMIRSLENRAWSVSGARRVWLNLLCESVRRRLSEGPACCWSVAGGLYRSLPRRQQTKHHHPRCAKQATWQEYLNDMYGGAHVVVYAPAASRAGVS